MFNFIRFLFAFYFTKHSATINSMFTVSQLSVPQAGSTHKLPVLLIDIPQSQSVTTLLLANTGSRYEQKQEAGLAHFFEHMVFKGTARYPTAQQLAETLDGVGADFNAFTGKEYTGYYVRSAATHFDLALDVLSDMLFAPRLDQGDIDREKGVIIEELNMYKDNPSAHVADVFEQTIFAEETLAHPIIGYKDTITSFQTKDFQRFLGQFYGPENLLLVIAGGLDQLAKNRGALEAKIQEVLSKLGDDRSDKRNARPQPTKNRLNSFSKERFKLIKRPTEQAHFVMAWPSLAGDHPDRFVLQVASALIGGNMSSRLFSQVREERGLAYYVHSDLDFFHDAGLFGCSAGVDQKRASEAIKVSKAVFTDILTKKGAISSAELVRAKEYLRGKTLLSLENSNTVAQFFGLRQLLRGQYISVEESLAKVAAVTKADIERVLEDILVADQLRLAVIGNFDNETELQESMS